MMEIDLRGLVCPMPVLKTKRALKPLAEGESVVVLTDDPHAVADIRLFIEQSHHELISQTVDNGVARHEIRKRN